MLRTLFLFVSLCATCSLSAQQTLTPRVAVYDIYGERFVVDSARLVDSVLALYVGDLSFEIAEERFARMETIAGGSFSKADQIYSFSLKNGETVAGQVTQYRRGEILLSLSGDEEVLVKRSDLQTLHREKRNNYPKPNVTKCATANFVSSPYALKAKEVVFSSVIYANTLEVGVGKGFSVKGLFSVVPIVLPTGYELSYRKRIEQSNFSIGMSVGQIWSGTLDGIFFRERINSNRSFLNLISSNFTYHMRSSYLKTGVTLFSGSSLFDGGGGYLVSSTYSMEGLKRPQNRWDFSLTMLPNNTIRNNEINTFFLAGYQTFKPRGSFTIGLGLVRGGVRTVIPFPYVYFSLYASKEQKEVANAFNMHRRMKGLKRYLDFRNAREISSRKRAEERELRRSRR